MFLPQLPVQGFLCAEEMHQSEFHTAHENLREGTSSQRILKVHSLILMAKETCEFAGKIAKLTNNWIDDDYEIVFRARSFLDRLMKTKDEKTQDSRKYPTPEKTHGSAKNNPLMRI